MRGRLSRMTPELNALLLEQAQLRAKVLTLKQIAHRTGFCPTYCQQVMQQMVKRRTVKSTVPRGTIYEGRT